MKAAVITLHTVCNYGTALQTFATQEKMREYFDEVCFIDYRREDTYGIGLLRTFTRGNPLKALPVLPTIWRWKRVFGSFLKKYIHTGEKEYHNDLDMEKFEDCADIYFTGSDQMWNTGWNRGIVAPFYLSFVPEKKPKYAYATSFGMSVLEEDDVMQSIRYIRKYKRITVREKSGVDILKRQYGYEHAYQVLDPTLAMSAEFWRGYAKTSKAKGEYILIYNLNRSREFDKYAKELSRRTGYKLIRFCTRYDQILRCGKSLLIPDVFDFITWIDHAKLIITDSFHATAFAMNMNTEPVCIYPEKYAERLSGLLQMLHAEDRHVEDYNDFSIIDRHVDFLCVNYILQQERKQIDTFFSKVLEENNNK